MSSPPPMMTVGVGMTTGTMEKAVTGATGTMGEAAMGMTGAAKTAITTVP
ncbi:hypothetical protein ACFLIM_29530 [Nonomuraea sp. M3C6]|uniref:Uncharacterized protein n=1 Tax=Nonomuraea marmarensis TaxID=3351344 RepID=A0ABW7AMI7_9ACTN